MGLYNTCAICGKKLKLTNQGYSIGNEKICFEDNSYLAKALGYKIPLGIKDTVKFELAKRQLPFEEAKNESEIPSKIKNSESIPIARGYCWGQYR